MKIAEGYLIKEVAGRYVLFPVGQNVVDYKNILSVNETGKFIVNSLQTEKTYEQLLQEMKKEYEATEEEVELLKRDLDGFLGQLRQNNLLWE